MRYKQMNNSSHLLGSGRFAAGVIVPNIIKNGGNILGIYKSIGNSATFLAESYGLNKNILIDELKPQLTNSYTNLFIL